MNSVVIGVFFFYKILLEQQMKRNNFPTRIICSQFVVPQIEYTLGGSNKKGSHVYFLLIVAMVLLL